MGASVGPLSSLCPLSSYKQFLYDHLFEIIWSSSQMLDIKLPGLSAEFLSIQPNNLTRLTCDPF